MKSRKITIIFLMLNFSFLYFDSFLQAIYGQDIIWKRTIMDTIGLKVSVDVEQKIYFLGGSGNSYVVKKYDSEGKEIWSLPITFEGNPDYVLFQDMVIDNNKNIYILVNYSNDYFLLRKYKSNRTFLWETQLQPSASTLTVRAVYVNNDNDVFLAGRIYLTQLNRAAWISKLDTSGTKKWSKTFDYGEWHDIRITDMSIDQNGNIYVGGYEGWTVSDIFIAKFDQNGDVIWDKRIGSPDHDEGWCIVTDYENNVIVHGYINKPWVGYENTGWLGKFNSNGDEIFTKTTYNGNYWGITFPTGLAIDNENNIYIGGYGGETEGFISKYDNAGNIEWTFKQDEWYDCPNDIAVDNFNNVYFIGDSTYKHMIFGKVSVNATNISNNEFDKGYLNYSLYQNYPNPFNPMTTIEYHIPKDTHVTVKIFNIRGELVRTLIKEKQSAGYHKILWNGRDEDGNSVAGGLYIYQLKADDFSQSNKMVLIR